MKKRLKPYCVFGAHDAKYDKGLVGYIDPITQMKAVTIVQLKKAAETADDGMVIGNIEGVYFTMYFAEKRGKEALDGLIEQLQECRKIWRWDDGGTD